MKNNIQKKETPVKVVISMEFGEDSIAIHETSFFKKRVSSRFVTPPLHSKMPDAAAGEIAEIFRSNDIARKRVSLVIPRHLVMAKTLRLPSVNEDEIREMVKMQSAKDMPYADGGVITGHRTIEKRPDGYSDVLAVMAQAEFIRHYINILNKAGISVEKIALSSEALFAWYLRAKGASLADKEPVVLVGINGEYIDIVVSEGKKLFSTRAFPCPRASGPAGHMPGGASNNLEAKITDNVKLALVLARKERAVSPGRIVIAAAEDQAARSAVNLKSETLLECEIMPQAGPPALQGLSLNGEAVSINLLPEDLIAANEALAIRKLAVKSAVLAACAGLILFSAAAKASYDKSACLASLNAEIAAIAPAVKEARAALDNMKIVKQDSHDLPSVTEMLDEIYGITPPEIKFNVLDCQPNGSFTFRGSAGSLDDTVKFIRLLEASKYFRNAKLQYTSKRQAGAAQVVDFEVTCVVAKGPHVR